MELTWCADVKKVGGGSSRNADHKSAASKKYSVHVVSMRVMLHIC